MISPCIESWSVSFFGLKSSLESIFLFPQSTCRVPVPYPESEEETKPKKLTHLPIQIVTSLTIQRPQALRMCGVKGLFETKNLDVFLYLYKNSRNTCLGGSVVGVLG